MLETVLFVLITALVIRLKTRLSDFITNLVCVLLIVMVGRRIVASALRSYLARETNS